MGGSSGGQTAMMVVWAIAALVAIGAGAGVYSLVRRRRARRP